jgi:hypothetical protein
VVETHINFNLFHPKYWLAQESGIALGEIYGPNTVEIPESYLSENILCLIFGMTTYSRGPIKIRTKSFWIILVLEMQPV